MEDVPVGLDVPLVIQIGKWRRQITMSEVKACQENVFADTELFRLPRNQSEGHLPKIGMSSGEADSLECLLRRLGVSDSEFTNPTGTGRVNIFADKDSATSYQNGQTYPAAMPNLWGTVENLRKYDIVLMRCQGSQADGRLHLDAGKEALKDYVDGGGRVFLEHYHYSWLRGLNEDPVIESARKYPATPFPPVAVWALPTEAGKDADNGYESYRDYQIDTGFPKGKDLADWLRQRWSVDRTRHDQPSGRETSRDRCDPQRFTALDSQRERHARGSALPVGQHTDRHPGRKAVRTPGAHRHPCGQGCTGRHDCSLPQRLQERAALRARKGDGVFALRPLLVCAERERAPQAAADRFLNEIVRHTALDRSFPHLHRASRLRVELECRATRPYPSY